MHQHCALVVADIWTPPACSAMVASMLNPKLLDDIAQRLAGAMPSAAKEIQTDLEKNLRAATQSVFGKLDLVTREEFDVQTKVLARSRARLEQLEKQVEELEAALLKK